MPKTVLFLFLLVIFSCSKRNDNASPNLLKPPLFFIINGGENSVDAFDKSQLELKNKSYINNSGDIFAHHINLSDSKKYLSIALPKYDFALGHAGLHNSTKEGGVAILETESGKVIRNFTTPQANHNAILVNNDTEIWTAGLNSKGNVFIYDFKDNKLLETLIIDSEPTELIYLKDKVFVACENSSFVYAIDTKTRKIIKQIKVDPFPESVYKSQNGDIYVQNTNVKSINIIDSEELVVKDNLDIMFVPGAIDFNIKNKELWVLSPLENKVYVFKKDNTWKLIEEIQTEKDPHHFKFYDNDNKMILVNQFSNTIQIIDTQTKKIIKTKIVGSKPNGIAVWE